MNYTERTEEEVGKEQKNNKKSQRESLYLWIPWRRNVSQECGRYARTQENKREKRLNKTSILLNENKCERARDRTTKIMMKNKKTHTHTPNYNENVMYARGTVDLSIFCFALLVIILCVLCVFFFSHHTPSALFFFLVILFCPSLISWSLLSSLSCVRTSYIH